MKSWWATGCLLDEGWSQERQAMIRNLEFQLHIFTLHSLKLGEEQETESVTILSHQVVLKSQF